MRLLRYVVTPLLFACLLVGCSSQTAGTVALPTRSIELGGRTFHVELATDDASRIQGLSDRESLAPDAGMLFVFPDAAVRQFVMRRCLFDIDIVFLGPNGRIVAMHAMKKEPYDTPEGELRRYSSEWPAQFAIELTGGTIGTLGLKVGQSVDLPLAELKALAD